MAKMETKRTRTGRGIDGKHGRRYELTDDARERIESLLHTRRRGRRWADHRTDLNAGALRRHARRNGKWETMYGRCRRLTIEALQPETSIVSGNIVQAELARDRRREDLDVARLTDFLLRGRFFVRRDFVMDYTIN
ncbi:MAG: hypothetical protein H6813_02480 [Phycisphaeraceae bacterium]|nr:hypothetical protein [Phycisphaeraceae bacterium]MCB9848816.1 hypothetical protein [Phycisphaeraceae bacterium]